MVAHGIAKTDDEAMRYAHQYAEDGPVKVVELVTVAMLAASRRQESE